MRLEPAVLKTQSAGAELVVVDHVADEDALGFWFVFFN